MRIIDIEGWMSGTDLEYLFDMVKSAPPDALIVELGTWKGRSTAALYSAMHDEQTVVTIDTWLGQPDLRWEAHREVVAKDLFLVFMDNMAQFGIAPVWWNKGIVGAAYLRMYSVDAAKLFERESVDVLFIDCDHRKVGEDIDVWRDKVKPSGVICGHDYHWTGVKPAVSVRFPIAKAGDDLWVRVG